MLLLDLIEAPGLRTREVRSAGVFAHNPEKNEMERQPDTLVNIIDHAADNAARIVAAYVGHNAVSATDLPKLITDTYGAITGLGVAAAMPEDTPTKPAVSVRASLKPDHLVCLHEGKHFKSLKRHLMTHHGQTPQQYREMFGLPLDYPMVAPNYSATRSALAKNSGLGRKVETKKGRR